MKNDFVVYNLELLQNEAQLAVQALHIAFLVEGRNDK
ncbi:MAG: hypothetical protein RL751_895 [Bacteroidota bacterium]